MRWELQIQRHRDTVAVRLMDRESDTALRTWRAREAHELLASGAVPRRMLAPGRHPCDKHTVWHLILAGASVLQRLRACPAEDADSERGLTARLERHGIRPTRQRLAVARALFAHGDHPTADDLYRRLRASGDECSRATVYNTLARFASRSLVRALVIEPGRVHYDTVTRPHPHLYNVDTGEVRDLPEGTVPVVGLPRLPPGAHVEEINVVIRVREPRAAGLA